jgi:NAD(P)-dependent dehydrogenase (short-subunit alcohol dehydrogenase family)
VAGVPLGRANEPEDIADMVVFLALPESRNVTDNRSTSTAGSSPTDGADTSNR